MRLRALPHLCCMGIGLRRCAGRDVSDNIISQLPPGPCSLPKLWKFVVGNNKLSLPDWVGNSSDLEMLDVSRNLLERLPDSVMRLPKLKKLDARYNRIRALPESLALPRAVFLYLDHNQLSELPEAIGNLPSLLLLDVSNNRLREMPEASCRLTELETLDASNNALSALPTGISRLKKLAVLKVSSNQLPALPEELADLSKLKFLYVASSSKLRKYCMWRPRVYACCSSAVRGRAAPHCLSFGRRWCDGNLITRLPERIANLTSISQAYAAPYALHPRPGLQAACTHQPLVRSLQPRTEQLPVGRSAEQLDPERLSVRYRSGEPRNGRSAPSGVLLGAACSRSCVLVGTSE
jgi:Leucine-rich repeat (LRR) protein